MEKIQIQGLEYRLISNYREAWNPDVFRRRYCDILNKYDYIVGDWGYGQLRLKGFFEDHRARSTIDTRISFLQEYLNEFCNFNCPYFVLKRVGPQKNTRSQSAGNG
ncbi:YutD family protein [Staphylospora marina]|uniref:YutD family protein n=1 Tax=Staphylospora marina TaxID=2490858 RepID=UPI000F5BA69F|nr:YutD family protein [Staphylospora marina]